MKAKILTLGLVFFFVFVSCQKGIENPHSTLIKVLTIKYFSANPANIILGKSSILSWEVMNATKVSIDNGIGEIPKKGNVDVSPLETTVYNLTASNDDKVATASCEITVNQNVGCVIPIEEKCYENIPGVVYEGKYKNIGEKTAYQVEVRIKLYHDEIQIGYTLIIGQGPPMNPGDIRGWEASWDTNLHCWDLKLRYEITWEE